MTPDQEAKLILQEHCCECPECGNGAFVSSGDGLEQAISTALRTQQKRIEELEDGLRWIEDATRHSKVAGAGPAVGIGHSCHSRAAALLAGKEGKA